MPPACHGRAWARGSSGELLFHASVWRCKEKPVSPSARKGEGREAFRSCATLSLQSLATQRRSYLCRSRTARIFLRFLKSRGEKKQQKGGISRQELAGTHNGAAAPSDNTLQSGASPWATVLKRWEKSWNSLGWRGFCSSVSAEHHLPRAAPVLKAPPPAFNCSPLIKACYFLSGVLSEALIGHDR